jgi:hypothetical protein
MIVDVDRLEIVRFLHDSKIPQIRGFSASLCLQQIEFPASIEIVDGFNECPSLPAVISLYALRIFS